MIDLRVEEAIRVALKAHAGQTRKVSDRPYVVHPLVVALLLARMGAGSEVIQAGILHDVVEDCDGWDCERIERAFGARVAGIVAELSEDKSRTWQERKDHSVDVVPEMSEEALLVKACDKLHNLASLRASLAQSQDAAAVWSQFHGGRERTIEASGRLVDALARRLGEQSDAIRGLRSELAAIAAS